MLLAGCCNGTPSHSNIAGTDSPEEFMGWLLQTGLTHELLCHLPTEIRDFCRLF